MSKATDSLMSYIRVAAGTWRNDPRDDAEVLARFAATRDETAFATLIGRHGPMVWRTCRAILGDTPDTEDAFQSTFLALSRQAGQSAIKNPVGWLYRVARRAALKVRSGAHRKRRLEQELQDVEHLEMKKDASRDELYAAVDEELADLPERLRVPLLLHYLEGKSQAEVARILGCAKFALQKRLAKGEAILHERLEKRGLTLGVISLAVLLRGTSDTPAIPAGLIGSTARAAVAFRAGSLTGGTAEGAQKLLHALTMEGVVRKCWWMVLTCVGFFGIGGAGLVAWKMCGGNSNVTAPEATKPAMSKVAAESRSKRVDICGDPLPEGALARLGSVRLLNDRIVAPVTFMPDGKTLIAGTENCLFMWEFPAGRSIRKLDNRNSFSKEVACANVVSTDGKLFAASTESGNIQIWDPSSGKQIGQLKGHTSRVLSLTFSSDNRLLISGSEDQTVRFWDIASGKEVRQIKLVQTIDTRQGIAGMAFGPDGRIVVIGQKNGSVRLYNLESGRSIGLLTGLEKIGDVWRVGSFAFSSDSQKLATAGTDGKVMLWDLESRKLLLQLTGCKGFQSVRISPDGKFLASGGTADGKIRIWDTKIGKSLNIITSCPGNPCFLTFSPDSKVIITCGFTQKMKLWDVLTGRSLLNESGHEYGGVTAVAFAPDGKSLASDSQFISPIGQSTSLLLWDTKTFKLRERLERKEEKLVRDFLAYSPDGKLLYSVGRDEKNNDMIWLWNATTGKRLPPLKGIVGDEGKVGVATFSPDGKTIAMADVHEKNVELCEIATGKRLQSLEAYDLENEEINQGVPAIAFSPDNQWLVSVLTNRIVLWDVPTGKQVHSLVIPSDQGKLEATMSSVAFSPNSRMLACGGNTDKSLHLWEVASGQERLKLSLKNGSIRLAFSPGGRLLASTNDDETIKLWDSITGQQIHQFPGGQGKVNSLAFAPDGRTLAAGNQDTTVLIWDVTPWLKMQDRPTIVSPQELQNLWKTLADADTGKAFQAMGKLIAASDQAIPLLSERLRPGVAASQQVTQLLTDLDNDDFQVRSSAKKKLQAMADEAEPFLQRALKQKLSLDRRRCVQELLNKWNMNGISLKLLQKLRAVEVLEYIDSDASKQLLQELAEATEKDEVEMQASAALERMNRRSH